MDGIDDYENCSAFSERDKAVLALADWMTFGSQGQMDAATLQRLRRHFSEAEIVELGIYFATVTGFQKFNTVFHVLYACEL